MLKILAVRLDNIGDLIQSIPSFINLTNNPNYNCYFLVNKNNASLLANTIKKEKLIFYNKSKSLIDSIAKHKFDWLINFSHEKISRNFIPKIKKTIPNRLGNINNISAFFCYNHKIYQKRSKSNQNEALLMLKMLEHLPANKNINYSLKPKLVFLENNLSKFKSNLKSKFNLKNDYLIVNIGSGKSALNWPIENYQKLIKKLLKLNILVVLSGTTNVEITNNSMLVKSINHKNLIDLSQKLTLTDFCLLVNQAKIVIAPSTGTLHIAGACQTKFVGLYPPLQSQSPTRWKPYLSTNQPALIANITCPSKSNKCLLNKCQHYNCMKNISVEQVFNSAISQIENEN